MEPIAWAKLHNGVQASVYMEYIAQNYSSLSSLISARRRRIAYTVRRVHQIGDSPFQSLWAALCERSMRQSTCLAIGTEQTADDDSPRP